jgi:hypothetical protein
MAPQDRAASPCRPVRERGEHESVTPQTGLTVTLRNQLLTLFA